MSTQIKQQEAYNMKKTPVKVCPLSSEKLRKKLTNQSTELRKERRKNLFDRRRINLPVNEGESVNSLSSNNTVSFPTQQFLNPTRLPTCALSSNELSRDNELVTIRIEEFKRDLNSKFLSTEKNLEGARALVAFISIENRNIYEFCSKEFVDYLLYKNPELVNYVNQNYVQKQKLINDFNDKSFTNYDESIRDTIILIDNIKTDLINCCFNHFDSSFIQLFFNFISSNFSFTLLTKDQQVSLVQRFGSLLSNRKLVSQEIPIYKQFFSEILDLVSVIQDTDKLYSILQSLEFWELLIRNTEFANEVIKNESKNELNSNFESNFQEYLLNLFDLSHYLVSSLEYGFLFDSNDKYSQNITKLLYNLNLIQSSKQNLNSKSLIFFIQILNNYFDPSDSDLTDSLITPQFLLKLCRLTRNGVDRSLTSNILGFFSNITSVDVYSFMLIDSKFTNHLEYILNIGKEDSNLIFYLLIIIKNVTSIDSSYFDLIFTKSVTCKLTNTFQFMNGDSLNELCTIIDNCINANSNVIKWFFQPHFIESMPTLIKSKNLNLIYLVLKILKKYIGQKNLKQDQLLNFISILESTGLIDLIDDLSSNQNNAVSELTNTFLDDYYKLAEFKENLY